LLGGVTSVTLARSEVGGDGKKQVMMRKYAPLFTTVLELRTRSEWYVHKNAAGSVDSYLRRENFPVLRTTPGKSEPVTAVPTEDGFEYDPPLPPQAAAKKTPFRFEGQEVFLPAKFDCAFVGKPSAPSPKTLFNFTSPLPTATHLASTYAVPGEPNSLPYPPSSDFNAALAELAASQAGG